jgi:hypothetical protein
VTACATASSAPSAPKADAVEDGNKKQLLKEIRESEGRQGTANPLAELMHGWLACQDTQAAGQALARALSLQGHGDPVWPGPGIWPLPPG